jgi:hypothetical protein
MISILFQKITEKFLNADSASYGKIKIIPLYHPAVAIYSRTQLPQLKQDFEVLKAVTIVSNESRFHTNRNYLLELRFLR